MIKLETVPTGAIIAYKHVESGWVPMCSIEREYIGELAGELFNIMSQIEKQQMREAINK